MLYMDLSHDDIDPKILDKVYTQKYHSPSTIQGVTRVPLATKISEDSDFTEIMRINSSGTLDQFPDFHVLQVNRSLLYPQSIKAWHLHFKQDEIWNIHPEFHLVIGLWDIRKKSPTCGVAMKFVLGESSELLFIPKGIAHGSANLSNNPVHLLYIVNQQFNSQNPDEHRIPWDALGENFWAPKRD